MPSHAYKLSYRELPGIAAKLRAHEDVPALAVRFAMLSVARGTEVSELVWDEIDLTQERWTLPAIRSKSNRPHRIPLSNEALHILLGLKENRADTQAIFVDARTGRPISQASMNIALSRIRSDSVVHVFRQAFHEWAVENATSNEAVYAALNWSVDSTCDLECLLEEQRLLMTAWSDFLQN